MSVPIGITIPKLLPITGTWSLPITAYFVLLSARVSAQRIDSGIMIGDRSKAVDEGVDPLQIASRSHSNFTENVPLALLLGAVVELNGGNRKVLSGAYAVLLLCRILHVELGIRGEGGAANGRLIGHLGSISFISGMAGYAAYLVKGYWGL